jgi:hypothetical protein
MAAARALLDESRNLHACERLLAVDDSELEAEERRIGAGFEEVARARGVAYDSASAAHEVEERIAAKLARRRECEALPRATVAGWWERLERAALAGNLTAMEDYGHLVVQASADAGGLFADIDEMARRKRLAFRFMRRVAATGNCTVSGDLERLSPDAASRYAYALVSVEMTRRFNDRPHSWGRRPHAWRPGSSRRVVIPETKVSTPPRCGSTRPGASGRRPR